MSAVRAPSPAIWVWRPVVMPLSLGTRMTVFNRETRRTKSPPLGVEGLPDGWCFVPGATPVAEAVTVTFATRSQVGAMMWYQSPLTYALT